MKISNIDKNFDNLINDSENWVFYDVNQSPFSLYGIFYDENEKCFLRMPQKKAKDLSESIEILNRYTAGGRLRFSTNAKKLCVKVKYKTLFCMPHMALRGSAGFSLCLNTDRKEKYIGSIGPVFEDKSGFTGIINLPKTNGCYTLHFPSYHQVDSLTIGLPKEAKLGMGKAYQSIKPIVYYGSSITQGGCASRADTNYEDLICKFNNVDYVNLGFSGNALAEPKMIDYIADIDCSIVVLDYDHNAPNIEYLEKTHFAMYERYRSKRPITPIVLISKPSYYFDGLAKKRLNVIKNTFIKAKKLGDENIYFIDGRKLFGKDWDICTVDTVHPTDLGFYKMSKIIGKVINDILFKKDKGNGETI